MPSLGPGGEGVGSGLGGVVIEVASDSRGVPKVTSSLEGFGGVSEPVNYWYGKGSALLNSQSTYCTNLRSLTSKLFH